MEIDLEKFYNLCLFYNNLKSNNIKFCICFISDVIEDKLENRIEEKIKLYMNDDKDIDKNLKIKEEKDSKEIKVYNNNVKKGNKELVTKKEKDSKEFILKMAETIKKNDKLREGLTLISNEIKKK